MCRWYITGKTAMTKNILLSCLSFIAMVVLSSCGGMKQKYIPQSTNMIHTVSFEDLELDSKDFDVLQRVEATSRIILSIDGAKVTIQDPDGEFKLEYENTGIGGLNLVLKDFEGVIRGGFLSGFSKIDLQDPEDIARRIALYRLINLVREQGGDYVIEPVYSINAEGESINKAFGNKKITITYMTTISGKAIRLKTTK